MTTGMESAVAIDRGCGKSPRACSRPAGIEPDSKAKGRHLSFLLPMTLPKPFNTFATTVTSASLLRPKNPNSCRAGACEDYKFAGLFLRHRRNEAQVRDSVCPAKTGARRSKAYKRHAGRINGVGKGNAWRRGGLAGLVLPNRQHRCGPLGALSTGSTSIF